MELSDLRQSRQRLWLCLGLVLVWASLYQAESANAARVPTKGLGQDVVVLCVQFNGTPTHRTCQEWVQQLNNKVTPWFRENSHDVTSFDFRLPMIHGGQSLPQGGWFPVTITGNDGVFVNNISNHVLPTVDPIVDFSTTDRLLIVGSSDTFFGQATPGAGPQQPYLSHLAFPVAEHGQEERWVLDDGSEQWRRRMAVAMIWEGRFFDPNKTQDHLDPVTDLIESEAAAIHELSHWLGLPDRYGGYASVPTPRLIADLYSLMGLTRWWKANPHWLGEARSDLGFTYDHRTPLTLGVGSSRLVHLIPGFMPTRFANEHYLARIPLQASGPFQGYAIEARQNNYHSWPARPPLLDDRTTEEGVLITWINEGISPIDYEITIVQDVDDTDPAHAPFEVGDVYEDPGQGVRIEVVSEEYEGYLVQVDVVAPGDLLPDPGITIWDTTRWETVDIWVDNQINGYGTLEFTNSDGTADGNGDRPEPEAENRVHFRIRNYGLAEAKNVQVNVYAAFPGAGDASSRWNLLGRAYLPSVPSQGFVESFVNWTPPAEHGGHACLKVEIEPLPNELEALNNLAQENVFEFESTRNSPWKSQNQTLFIHNPFDDRELLVAMDVRNLPTEWAVMLYPETFTLAPDGSQEVTFELHPSGFASQPSTSHEEGQIFNVGVVAHAWTSDQDHLVLGGVSAMTQLKHRVTVDLELVDPSSTSATLGGCLSWSIPDATVALRITDPKGNVTIDHTISDAMGCFYYTMKGSSGAWSVAALYDGVGIYSSARSEPLVVKFP